MKAKTSSFLVFLIAMQLLLLSCAQADKAESKKELIDSLHNSINQNKDILLQPKSASDNVKDSFVNYLNKFALKELPVSFGEKEMNETQNANYNLDTLFVSKFIEKNQTISEDLNLYNLKRYVPLFKIKNDALWVAVVKFVGGSGGIDDEYHLLVYDLSGKAISNLLVGFEKGDCGFEDNQTFIIKSNYIISCKRESYTGDCDADEMKLSKTAVLSYQITPVGNVKQLQ